MHRQLAISSAIAEKRAPWAGPVSADPGSPAALTRFAGTLGPSSPHARTTMTSRVHHLWECRRVLHAAGHAEWGQSPIRRLSGQETACRHCCAADGIPGSRRTIFVINLTNEKPPHIGRRRSLAVLEGLAQSDDSYEARPRSDDSYIGAAWHHRARNEAHLRQESDEIADAGSVSIRALIERGTASVRSSVSALGQSHPGGPPCSF